MPALETIRGVPIARVGVWSTSTGPWVCTPEQLADAVRASSDPTFRAGVLKLGHTDARFNDPGTDGSPALGRLENLRVDASGEVLLADLVGVPRWLAEVLNSAYPSRSVEASLGVVTAGGDTYSMVVTGLALLGETPPAIESLGDIAALYDQPTDLDSWVAAARLAASIDPTGAVMADAPCPTTTPHAAHDHRAMGSVRAGRCPGVAAPPPRVVLASALLEELLEQAVKYAAANGVQGPWVREVYTDKVIVMGGDADDMMGMGDDLFEIGYAETGGAFTFTGPFPVQVEYTRLPAGVDASAASGSSSPGSARVVAPRSSTSAIRYGWGRGDVSASTPEEHPPVSDIAAQVRERLGLPPDATDEQLTAALDARLGAAGPPATGQTPPTPPPTDAPTGDPAAAAGPESVAASSARDAAIARLVEERVAAAVAPFRDRLEATSAELAKRKEADRVAARDSLLASAVSAGKITPADRPKWAEMYDKGPESATAVEQVFASLAKGTAVPVAATAGARTAADDEPVGDGFTDAEYTSMFGDERAGARS